MVLKLYKRLPDAIHYWEAWNDGRKLFVHFGILGHKGKTREIPLRWFERASNAVSREASGPRGEGYAELPAEAHTQIVVQYRTAGWGNASDLEKRYQVESIINDCLGLTGNGDCDGGDIGSGTINAFSYVVDPVLAMHTIVDSLRTAGLLQGAIIAVEHEDCYTVLWPYDYLKEFKLWYDD